MISLPRRRSALVCASVAAVLTLLSGTSLHADEPVVWTNLVGTSASGNTLTKTGGAVAWDSGAASANVIRDGYGYFEFTKADTTTRVLVGLSNGDTNASWEDVDFAIHPSSDGNVYIYEASIFLGSFGSYAAGDRFRVEIRYGVVRYFRNAQLLYTSTVAPKFPLRVDATIYNPGTEIIDARVGNLAWANAVGVTVGGSSLTKTGATGWTSGAVSANAIEAADGAMEFSATETNTTRAAGLGNADTNQDLADIEFGIKVRDDAVVEVVEGGTSRGTFGAYASGDRFRVEVAAGSVTYARNGSIFYTSTASPTYPLRIDTALYSAGATLTDLTLTPLVWTNASGVSVSENGLTKTAADGWNAGASSTRALASGDGFVEFTAIETNTRRSVGLKGSGAASSYADIDYAVDLGATGQLEVFELGVSRGQVGTYAHGDRLRVEIQDGVVRYVKNGSLLYTSTVAPTYPLHAEAQLYTSGATVRHLEVGDVVWINPVGVQVAASGIAKTATSSAWDSGAISTRAIDSGYVEATVSGTNTYRMIGLGKGDTSASYTDLDFGAFASADGATIQVYESGTYRGTFGTYVTGDRLRVAVESGVVKYYKNSTLFYTSTVSPTLPLRIDSSFYNPGANLLGVVFVGDAVSDTLEPPVISPGTGTYTAAQTVTITALTGSTIRYTTNGTDPIETSATYTAPVTIDQSMVLKAKAWKAGYQASPVASATYELKVPNPGLTPGGGTYTTPQSVVISESLAGADIHYTTNGADPTQADTAIASGNSVSISSPTTLKVAAWKSGWTRSDIVAASYAFQVATPTLTPAQGNYTGALPVTVATATPGATLHYRIDGGEPTASDPVVESGTAVTLAHSATLKAVGVRAGWANSPTAAGTYWISLGTAATPVLSPAPGTFTAAQAVTISTTTGGAVIRYTTDGTEPGFQSPIYSSALTVGRTTVVKARAFAADMTGSASAGGLYRIDLGTVDPPRFSPGGGSYAARQSVTVTSETAGASIHYRTDGLIPDESDPVVSSGTAITVGQNMHLTARAFKSAMTPSVGVAADYTITGAAAVASNHTVALRADGTVWTWGHNSFGVLGDPALGNFALRTTPAQVAGIADVIAVATGSSHTLALKADGTVYAWGRNISGELGNGSGSQSNTPVQALGLADIVAIAAGDNLSLALKRDGSVWVWGTASVDYGSVPVQVTGLRGISAIALGTHFGLAVQSDGMPGGTLWAWGSNFMGALGDGTATDRASPVAVANDVRSVGGGNWHAYAVKADGTALAWGLNGEYQLGNGTTVNQNRPTPIPGLTEVASITGGAASGGAVRTDGTILGWGANDYGQLGDQTGTARPTPVEVFVPSGVAVAAHGSAYHRAAVISDGTLWTWGKNDAAALGDGTTLTNATPKPVPNFTLTSNALWSVDSDGDGLTNTEERALGTDGRLADTNGDGIPDGAALKAGLSATNTDMDADGVSNADESARGTDPFRADTDDDAHSDAADCFPLDATRWQCPAANPNDHTPPIINLQEPTNASLVSSVPPQ